MKKTVGFITFFAGLLITLNGVGGVDASTNNFELTISTVIAVLGVAIMALGTQAFNKEAK
jgi:hypothetical protein